MSDQNKKAAALLNKLIESASSVIKGKDEEITLILAAWLAGGNVLLEDVPGTGKTLLSKTLAKLVDIPFGRVQFTPDLLPSDITGSSIYDQQKNSFKFEKGPLFSPFFLADEINRATPRTQSALLEAMGEMQITADNKRYPLNKCFFVVATQNPIEHHGTFPLPEAQLDRFSIKLSLGYMNLEDEVKMLKDQSNDSLLANLKPILDETTFLNLRTLAQKVVVHDEVYKYIVSIVHKTRSIGELEVGCSPRASKSLLAIAQTLSLIKGESFVKPSLVHYLCPFVLGHRMVLSQDSRFSNISSESIVKKILSQVQPPTN